MNWWYFFYLIEFPKNILQHFKIEFILSRFMLLGTPLMWNIFWKKWYWCKFERNLEQKSEYYTNFFNENLTRISTKQIFFWKKANFKISHSEICFHLKKYCKKRKIWLRTRISAVFNTLFTKNSIFLKIMYFYYFGFLLPTESIINFIIISVYSKYKVRDDLILSIVFDYNL